MSDSRQDETFRNAILSADTGAFKSRAESHQQSRTTKSDEHKIVESEMEDIYLGEKEEENSSAAFLLKNAYCVIVNNGSFETEDLAKYYDRKILELRRFLERIADFSTIKMYENRTGVHFLRIFENVIEDPLLALEQHDGFLCFVLCENEASLKHKTSDINIQGAVSRITKSPQLDKRPKLFFIQEVNMTKKPKKGNHPPLSIEDGNELLLVHERRSNTLSKEGLLPKLLELFQDSSDCEDILTMLAKCSYSAIYTQVHNLSKPVVFANCYDKRETHA